MRFDPFGSMQNMLGQFQQFMGNPLNMINKMNIPQEYMKDPNEAIQYLMNTGKLTQQQYNELNQISQKIQNNPMFKQFIKGM